MGNELIKVVEENGKQVVSARELHDGLGIGTPFHKWMPRMIEYGFEESVDYAVTDIFVHNSKGGRQTQVDYAITLDMAKEISMIQRNEIGKQFRLYFIECERRVNEITSHSYMITDPIKRAEMWIEEEKVRQQLSLELKEAQPKLEKFGRLMDTDFTYTPTQMAKCYGVSSANKLNKMMNERRICYKQGKVWLPYAGLNEEWYKFVVNEYGSQLRFSSKGVVEIADLLELDINEEVL